MNTHRATVFFRACCLHLGAVAGLCSGFAHLPAWGEEGDEEGAFRVLRERMVDNQLARGGYGRDSVRDKAVLKALVPKVEKALANASGAEHKQHLARVKDWLNKGGPAPAAAAVNTVSATSNNRSRLASRLKKTVCCSVSL